MDYKDLFYYVKNIGKDPSALLFEDELTGLYNRRFLQNYLQFKIAWDALEGRHVSLLMMDIDYFKKINDTYGHDMGDHTLVHLANILREVSTDTGLPIRYGGDEFMILLQGKDQEAALEIGKRLVRMVHEKPFQLNEGKGEIYFTLSVGIATAPCDAVDGKVLIQKADTALYHAKQSGRDRVADMTNIATEDVFPKIAIQSLENLKMAGRGVQLAQITDALKKVSQGESQFLIVEGPEGMGKSAFLQMVQKNLERSSIAHVSVSGTPQELFRPYYLISRLLVELMNGRKDKGKQILSTLSPTDMENLSFVLPSLTGLRDRTREDAKNQRGKIFQSFIRFINKLVDFKPFMVFIDDLHFADEASLLLLRAIILQRKVHLFLCGASSDFRHTQIEINPLQRFWQIYGKELGIRQINLTPLSDKDIAQHLEGIFPSLSKPDNFEKDLCQISDGNPLFVYEILSKLIHDQKIVFTGQQWTIQPLDSKYLSASLDEIINEKIVSLDEETKGILDHASIFGESVSLSMLTGSFEGMETHVLDFLDKATASGLVTSNFQADDENIRFLSKRIQEIVYGNIEQDRKENLHEKIALYQEKLFNKHLLPSVAILAWHFRRAANLEKARIYEQQHQEYGTFVFSTNEAIQYSDERDTLMPDIPLDPRTQKELPYFFRFLLIAVRSIKLYPPVSTGRRDALNQFKATLDRILADRGRLRLTMDKDSLIVNGEAIDTTDFKSIAERICKLFVSIDLCSFSIMSDYTQRELNDMLEAVGLADGRKINPRYWRQVCEDKGLEYIELKQVRYAKVAGDDEPIEMNLPNMHDTDVSLQSVHEDEHGLAEEALPFIPQWIVAFTGALSKMKLYPVGSSVVSDAIDQVMVALEKFLSVCPILTVSAVDTSLLINGVKIDTMNFEAPAASFLRFLQSTHLSSVTFTRHVSSAEVASLLTMVIQQPASGLNPEYWQQKAKNGTFKGILFNRGLYAIFEEMVAEVTMETSANNGLGEKTVFAVDEGDVVAHEEPISDRLKDFHEDDLADTLKDLMLRGRENEFSRLLKHTFREYASLPISGKESLLEICKKLTSPGEFVPPPRFLIILAEHLQVIFKQEEESKILECLLRLLQQMAFSFLQYGEYAPAGWVFVTLKERLQELKNAGNNRYQCFMETIQAPLPPQVLAGLRGDLKSSDFARQQKAVLFLSTMDDRILPFIVDMIKQEDDLRVRQMTAGLIERCD